MRRLDGGREVEKIRFGRELFALQRRKMYFAMLCGVTILACIVIGIFVLSSRDNGEEKTPPQSGESGGEILPGESESKDENDGVTSEEKSEIRSEESSSEKEEATKENPIVYKDFSTNELNVVNNTAFDISFLDSYTPNLSKYYDASSEKPIVLILHTYTSDRYADSDERYGVCAVGQLIADRLNAMGIGAVYSSAVHDGDLNDPMANARETIRFYLKMYPSIKYVFDVGVMQEYQGESVIATSGEYMGQRAAQIRLSVAGNNMSTGRDNLVLAAQINKNLRRGEMNLAREIVYDASIKNSIMTPYYLEIFIGSSGNTESEAIISARAFANAFGEFLI